jgi:hypothetical protein
VGPKPSLECWKTLAPTRNKTDNLQSFCLQSTKGKVKLSLFLINQATCHEDVWGSGDIAPYILDLRSGWRRTVGFTSCLLPPPHPEKSHRHPLPRRLGGPKNQYGRYEVEKNICSYQESKPSDPDCSLLLYWWSSPSSCLQPSCYTNPAIPQFLSFSWTLQNGILQYPHPKPLSYKTISEVHGAL